VNLRILCPNCHSQTPTFKTGVRGRYSPPSCLDCGKQISKNRSRCQQCAPKHGRKTKINWPGKTQLQKLVKQHGYRGTGHLLGVSDTAVRKHLKSA
jgi:predicted amidophosphoribosyltransferase